MPLILPKPSFFVKERFLKRFRKCRQALVRGSRSRKIPKSSAAARRLIR
jgi:hypothetical protein